MVVEEQPDADHPGGAQVRLVGKDEAQRPDDVWCGPQEHLALGERLADQRELELLQIAQAAVDELGARARRMGGKIVALAQPDTEASPGRVTRDADAVDAATDYQDIDLLDHRCFLDGSFPIVADDKGWRDG
jgi:hypothetical protein